MKYSHSACTLIFIFTITFIPLQQTTAQEARTFSGHSGSVLSVAFSPDGQYALSGSFDFFGSSDEPMKLWEVDTGRQVRTFSGRSGSVYSVAFSPDGQYALSGSDDETMKLWEVDTGRQVRTFSGHSGRVLSVAFSPDGQYALSGSRDNTMKLWEVDTGRLVRTFTGHDEQVNSVAFSPDGQYALSGSVDDTMKLWEVDTGRQVRTFSDRSGSVYSVAFSPDGQYALSGSGGYDKTMKLWAVSSKAFVEATVKKRIEFWQQKGKYESTDDYQKRVTEEKRRELIQTYTAEVVDSLGRERFDPSIQNTNYDADNQIFEVIFADEPSIYVEVPVSEASEFDQNLNRLRFSDMDFAITSRDELILRKAQIYNPGNEKTYAYDSGHEVAFNTAEMAANFDPIDVDVQIEDTRPNVRRTTQRVEVGKADVDVNVPETGMSNPDAIAVVIGNRNYQGDTPDVDFAINDAKVVKEYLVKTLGFKEGNILDVENASKSRMEVLLGDDNNQGRLAGYLKGGRSDVFFFYSGHGAPDPNTETGYLMPVDADPSALAITGYPLDVLYNNLGELDARSVNVVIDACFSGATGGGEMLVQNASPIGIEVRNPAAQLENGFVVTASSGSQVSSWYPEKGHGLLTYFWLKALQGEADADGDGAVTTSEVSKYLTDPTDGLPYFARRLHNREQMPQVFGSDTGKIIVKH